MKAQSLLYAVSALQSLVEGKNVLVESLPNVPAGWSKLGDAKSDQLTKLRIALEQPGLARFEQTLYDISTPQHALYGQHLSREDARELLKPAEESTAAVLHWLRSAGIDANDIEENGEWINFKTTVSKAADLLDTQFSEYTYTGSDQKNIRTLHYSVPEEIRAHITMIQPTTRFGQIRTQNIQTSHVFKQDELPNFLQEAAEIPPQQLNVTFCNKTVTPECLRALYKIGDAQADPDTPGFFGINGFLEEYAKHDALDTFLQKWAPYAVSQNFTTIKVNGGLDNQNDTVDLDVEANLDMQYAAAIGFDQEIKYYSITSEPDPNNISNEPYLELLTHLLDLPNDQLPHTLTTSYGEDEQSVPKEYAKKVCNMFAQLGSRGVSVLFSSGDTGPGSSCQTNDGKNTTRFLPIFPGACPHLTSVGGTIGVQPERAVSFSSGGFSEIHSRPKYQDEAVSNYVSSIGDTFKDFYNPTGRGFPDVSAQGANFVVISGGNAINVGGTSASAPTFAGIIALLNNARLSNGLKPLGFLNPWLYSNAHDILTDIVDGGSTGCTGRDIFTGSPAPYVPGAGWNATTGWDPVTGLGTPLFDKMLADAVPGYVMPSISDRS
ncbi:subtilisin-like protein [Xylaria intraflava]|nr:subtilisin-like protein [Xylaria intraflava]